MAGLSDPAACPVCGPGTDVQPHCASFRVLPSSAAQPQHVWCPGILLQVGAQERGLVAGGPGAHGNSPDLYPHSEDAPGDPERVRLLEALLEEAGLENPYLQNSSHRRVPQPGPSPSLALASPSGLRPVGLGPYACLGPGSLHIPVPLEAGCPQPCLLPQGT